MSDGYMKMWIMGTDERDYYLKLDSEITRYISPPEVIEEHPADSGYYDGQILEHGTTGYIVRSYKYRYDKETNELISKDFVALSSYMTKEMVIVKIVGGDDDKDDETEATDPSESTEPSTDEPSSEEITETPTTEATTPTTEATTPPTTQATQPPATDPPATDPPTPPPSDQPE